MNAVYTFGIRFYAFVLWILSPFHLKASKWIKGRKNIFRQLPQVNPENSWFWFHCASLGEFDMALPIMEEIRKRCPESRLLVTFFSPSGMEHYHKRKFAIDFACYLPIDTPKKARRFLAHFNPKAAFFVKYEFWSNFIFEAKKQKVVVYSVCTIMRKEQRFFKWYGAFFRKTLASIDFFFVQNQSTASLLRTIGLTNVVVTGDTRFDRVLENSLNIPLNSTIEYFLDGQKAWVFGSTWPKDEVLLESVVRSYPNQKIILAPHDISETHVSAIEQLFLGRTCRYSAPDKEKQVLLLNTIGHLSSAYAYGELAYVGGGFSGKLHNILEPSVFGLPVFFGPRFERFPEASDFCELGIGFSVSSTDQFNDLITFVVRTLHSIRMMALQNMHANQGAATRICEVITTTKDAPW
jgi:3-deoxy-D-manno-octulosonic-acid transferase